MAKQGDSTKQLKKTLGFWDLMSTAIGQIIGAGIMTLLGAAIALTGRSVPIAFIISAVLVVGFSIPKILICGAVCVRGGEYTMIAMLAGKRMAGIYTVVNALSNLSLAMFSLSFASYFISLFHFGDEKIIALILTTVFFVVNIIGVDVMAKFQNIIVILLCVALGVFAAFGVGHIQPDYLTSGFMTNGIGGLFQAGGLLTFAVGGGTVIANLSAEAKNPIRDIPLVMIVSTLAVALVYGAIGVVAAGVLPVEQVAGINLATVAENILSRPLYVFFIVCGAMFALISTLNAQFAWATKPILQGCDDGWLPQKLAYLHPKYKTPVVLLAILYVLAVVCIISGLSISILGNLCLILTTFAVAIICAFIWKLPQISPAGWEKSKFKSSKPMLTFILIFSTACAVFNIWLNVMQLSTTLIIGNVVLLIIAVIFAEMRLKHVDLSPSYEEIVD
nr:APC family permease [uncultured Draconibacterium sp.]